jgi:hypothetical protein
VTVSIYNAARINAETRAFSWTLDGWRAVITKAGYTFDPGHFALSQITPLRGEVNIDNPTIDTEGWCDCDPITFATTPINSPIDHVVLYRPLDGLLLIDISFPAMQSPISKPLLILKGFSRPGLFRV